MTSDCGIDKTLPILSNTLIAPIEGEVCALRHRATFVSPGRTGMKIRRSCSTRRSGRQIAI
jgi:hypothetical protein